MITDTERLNWLLQNSGLSPADCEGQTIFLVVTEAAVKKCAGTHLPEYQQDVRDAIDALMSPIVKAHLPLAAPSGQRLGEAYGSAS